MINSEIEITTFKPSKECIDVAKKYEQFLGQEIVSMLYQLSIIEEFVNQENTPPHLFIQLLKAYFSVTITECPNKLHYEIAREVLMMTKENYNEDAVLMLGRALFDEFGRFEKRLKLPHEFLNHKKRFEENAAEEKVQCCLKFIECPNVDNEFELQFFEKTGRSLWDNAYLNLLRTYGSEGKKRYQEFEDRLKKNPEGWQKSLWFVNSNTAEEARFWHSPAILLLGCVLWKDVVRKQWNFKENNIPALTTSVQTSICKMLTPKNEIIRGRTDIQVFHQDSLLGSVSIPTLSESIMSTVFNGVQKLNTVTGHRIIRFFVQTVFEQRINGCSDYRVLKNDRGARDIVERLGLNSHNDITCVKEIVHAMAFFYFQDPQINGNLIQLNKYKSPITGRIDEGYLITIGPPLIPYQTFEAYKKGECGLLIPLLKDPPLVNPNQYHAGQYLFQMAVMGEFSKNSIQFSKESVIEIPKEKMSGLALACGLPMEVLKKVVDRWTQDGDNGGRFLERVEAYFFTLGPGYKKAVDFLKKQGELRIKQSARGKASAIKQAKIKQGGRKGRKN